MKETSVVDKFQGKEFWRTLNLVIFFIMYAIMFVVPVFFPDQIWIVALACAFLIMLYVTIQQFVYRKMERKNAGRRVLYGWIDEEEDMGEEYEIPIKKISPFDRLSESDQISVENFMEAEKSKMSAIGLKEDRITRYINEGYTYEENKSVKENKVIEDYSEPIEYRYEEDNSDGMEKYDREEFEKWKLETKMKEIKEEEEDEDNGED
jgi:hypothetical protein